MSRAARHITILTVLSAVLLGCGQSGPAGNERAESREAKELLQGVWADESTELVVFKMEGDSVYYPDSTSMTAYFKVIDDTLYIGSSARYHIERQTQNALWFQTNDGETIRLVRDTAEDSEEVFTAADPKILTLTEVLKRDTVVMYDDKRYHLYIAINPTRYKVVRHTLNSDGLDVENIYYDNIIHISVFQGNRQLFSRDFRKQQYQQKVPEQYLQQGILNNMEYDTTDADGFHFRASLCMPGDASCYQVEHIISFDGRLSAKAIEF